MFLSFFPDYSSEPVLLSEAVSETKDLARLDKEYDTAATNHLEMLADSASTAPTEGKSSYSPFGSNKPKGSVSNSNILYQPPVDTSSFFDDVTPQQSSLLSKPPAESLSVIPDVLPSDEERDSIPVANYLERLVIPLDDTSAGGKKSFSPFGDGGKILKGQTSDSNILYKPPAQLSVSDELPSDEERDRTPVSNYLERLVISLDDAFTSSKKSFSPFGDGGKNWKGQASDSNFLYDPPFESSVVPHELPSDEERDNTPVSNYLEKLVISLSGASNFLKKSFSPFGDGGKTLKGQRSGSDILYKPPVENPLTDDSDIMREDRYVEQEEYEVEVMNQNDSYQEENGGSTYLTSLSDFEKPLKSSYSPFGFSGTEKFESSISDLYTTAETQNLDHSGLENNGFTTEPTDHGPSIDEGRENYLESLGGAVPYGKKSFSPFGSYSESKLSDGSTDTLYDSP